MVRASLNLSARVARSSIYFCEKYNVEKGNLTLNMKRFLKEKFESEVQAGRAGSKKMTFPQLT